MNSVILSVAAETKSAYEWHQHVAIAVDLGISIETISAIARDDRTPFSENEQALLAYTRAVVRGRVTDPLHRAVTEFLEENEITGVAATASGYLALARVIDALGVEIEAGDSFVGWDPR